MDKSRYEKRTKKKTKSKHTNSQSFEGKDSGRDFFSIKRQYTILVVNNMYNGVSIPI